MTIHVGDVWTAVTVYKESRLWDALWASLPMPSDLPACSQNSWRSGGGRRSGGRRRRSRRRRPDVDEVTGPQSDVVRQAAPQAEPERDVPAPRDPSGYYQVPIDPPPAGE